MSAERAGALTGRVALVTGASSGIGAAIARSFLDAGARVHAAARRHDVIAAAVGPEYAASGQLRAHALDVADAEAIDSLARRLAEEDPIDILVCAAGTNVTDRQFGQLTYEAWDEVIGVNLTSVFHLMRSTLDQIRQRGGDVVLISSVAAAWPDHSGAAYQASKAGLLGLARGAGRDEHGRGVWISTILPGIVDTPLLDRRPSPPPPEVREWCLKSEDIAAAALCAVSLPPRAHLAEMTLVSTRLQSMGNTQQATPALPSDLSDSGY